MQSHPQKRCDASALARIKPPYTAMVIAAGAAITACVSGQIASAQTDTQAAYWSRNDFVIPFQLDPAGEVPREIRLEVSEDGGQSWQLHQRVDVRTRQFRYEASRDGEFLFRLKTVDAKGNVYENPGEPMKVVIDTTKPSGELVVDMNPQGKMQVECRMSDAALDTSSVRLEFQTELNSQWIAIPCEVQPNNLSDSWIATGSWEMPAGASQLVVRATARDRAGNSDEWTRIPRLPRSAGIGREMKLASKAGVIRIAEVPPINALEPDQPITPLPKTPVMAAPVTKPPVSEEPVSQTPISIPQTPISQTPFAGTPRVEVIGGPGARRTNAGLDRDLLLDQNTLESQQRLIEYQNRLLMQQRAIANSSLLAPIPPAEAIHPQPTARLAEPQATPPSRSDALHSNRRQFSLDYSIEHDSGASVSTVELWGTTDQGVSWQRWGTDTDLASPFDIEVADDGLFGFTMVIVGANGVGSKRPLPGDAPEAWVRVDTVAPQARIVSALHGKGVDAGSLLIEYQAFDDFFGERPISLSWSASPQGPWQPLAQGARNNGRYTWTPDAGLPPTVYLRIEAIDAAGNVTAQQLDLPVDVQGATPRGRIQGVRPQR